MKAATLLTLVVIATPALAQSTDGRQSSPVSEELLRVRYQIGVMERVLEQAVQHGAQMAGRQLPRLTPNIWLFSGPIRARGFVLAGYGLFFDVEVPALRRSLAWSLQTLEQQGLGIGNALRSLRTHVESLADPPARGALEEALLRIELQVGPVAAQDIQTSAGLLGVSGQSTPTEPPSQPDEAYTAQVKLALIDAMLDHSGPISLGPDEWLTVAARGGQDRFGPADASDVLTIVLRITGRDMGDFRAGRLSREEATQRVEVSEF